MTVNRGDIKMAVDLLNQIDEQDTADRVIDLLEKMGMDMDRAIDERNRLSELCDKWNAECDEMREDNKRLEASAKSWEDIANALSTQDNKLIAEMTQQAVDAEEAITSLLAKLEALKERP